MKKLAKIGSVILILVFLYAGTYVAGRVGKVGLILDDSVGYSVESDGRVTLAMGGGMIALNKNGRILDGLRRGLNVAFVPMREIDHTLTGNRFYWVFRGESI